MRSESFVREKSSERNHKRIDQSPMHSWPTLHCNLGKAQGVPHMHSDSPTAYSYLVVCDLRG